MKSLIRGAFSWLLRSLCGATWRCAGTNKCTRAARQAPVFCGLAEARGGEDPRLKPPSETRAPRLRRRLVSRASVAGSCLAPPPETHASCRRRRGGEGVGVRLAHACGIPGVVDGQGVFEGVEGVLALRPHQGQLGG